MSHCKTTLDLWLINSRKMKFKIEKENFLIQLTDEEKLDVNILKRVSDKIFRNFQKDKNLIISKIMWFFKNFCGFWEFL